MKTSSLYYKDTRTVGNIRVSVKIRLSDDCRNGYNDFAITGTVSELSFNGLWGDISSGCCHDGILKVYPEFRPFVDLHLCDAKGAPMYPEANGFYFLEKKNKQDVAKSYLRLTEPEYERIKATASDRLCLKYLLYDMGIVARWEREAKEAIKLLEELTGKTFTDDSRRYQLTPLTGEETELIERRMSEGYYQPEAIESRRLEAVQEKINDIRKDAVKAIRRIETALAVKIYLLEMGMSLDNFIYYDHTNTGVFNWRCTSGENLSQEEFVSFLNRVDYSKLPADISFDIKQ